jgi:hypothetical protein
MGAALGKGLNGAMATSSLSPLPDSEQGATQTAADLPYLLLAEKLAYWMDRRYIDPILGFVLPGAGDAIGAGIGLLGIYAAFRLRAHPVVIARMLINLAIDSAIGAIPFLGAVVDIFYRAHTRNLALLRSRDVRVPRPSDWLAVGAAALLLVMAMLLPVAIVIAIVALWNGG